MRNVWLALAVLGTIHPMYYFISWFQANTWDIMAMVDAWHVNAATSGLVWDLIYESLSTRNFLSLLAIPATFMIGVSCGLPLYLYLRSRVVYTRDKHKVRDF